MFLRIVSCRLSRKRSCFSSLLGFVRKGFRGWTGGKPIDAGSTPFKRHALRKSACRRRLMRGSRQYPFCVTSLNTYCGLTSAAVKGVFSRARIFSEKTRLANMFFFVEAKEIQGKASGDYLAQHAPLPKWRVLGGWCSRSAYIKVPGNVYICFHTVEDAIRWKPEM